MDNYQCDIHLDLLNKSLKDTDNREKRRAVINHPIKCNHPVCKKVFESMSEIMGKVLSDLNKKQSEDLK